MNRTSRARRAAVAATVSLIASGLIAGTAGAAHAAERDGILELGEFVQWDSRGYSGGCLDIASGDDSLWNDYFLDCGTGMAGVGQPVWNNAESGWNFDTVYTVVLYTGLGYTGAYGYVRPYTGGDFGSTYRNNVESLSWRL
jgi:hypothetical protein